MQGHQIAIAEVYMGWGISQGSPCRWCPGRTVEAEVAASQDVLGCVALGIHWSVTGAETGRG